MYGFLISLNSSLEIITSELALFVSIKIYLIGLLIEKLEMDFLISKECSVKNSSILVGNISTFIYFFKDLLMLISPFSRRITLVSRFSLLSNSFWGGSFNVSIIYANSFLQGTIGYSAYLGAIFLASSQFYPLSPISKKHLM